MNSDDNNILLLQKKVSEDSDEPIVLTQKMNVQDTIEDKSTEASALKDLIAQVAPSSQPIFSQRPSAYDFLDEKGSPAFRALLENTVTQFLEDRWSERLDKLVEERVEIAVEKEIARLRILLSKEIGTLPEDL